MPPLTAPGGLLQVHPTRRCNLECLHCYSDSGPAARDELAPDVVCGAVSDAAELGYRVLSVSGGEPLMYRPLPQVLAHARAHGMRTLVTTNGTMTGARHLQPIAEHLDLLALSLDGPPDDHDRMRARAGAFDALRRRLDGVRASGVPFGFLFTLTQHNVHQLEWAAEFAVEQGAALLQIHPLEPSGRALAIIDSVPDERERAVAIVEAARLRQAFSGAPLQIHVDLVTRAALQRMPDATAEWESPAPLADLVSPLVIEPDGRCVPLEYGFPSAYELGNLNAHRLNVLAESWREAVLPRFRDLMTRVHTRLTAADAPIAVSWYAEAGQTAGLPELDAKLG